MTAARTPRGPYANASVQREKILLGALEYFGQKGFWGSSMRDIADHVGMSQASMRYYFGTKIELLTAVLDERDLLTAEVVERTELASGSHINGIVQIVVDNAQHPNIVRLFTILSAEATSEDHPAHEFFRARYERVTAHVAELLQRAIDDEEIQADVNVLDASRLLLATMSGLQVQWLLDPAVNMAELFRDHVLRYLGSALTAPPV
jgi:AcrR family transcriptional regulator